MIKLSEYARPGFGLKGQEHSGWDTAAGNLRGSMADDGTMENQVADILKAGETPVPKSVYAGSVPAQVPWLKFAR